MGKSGPLQGRLGNQDGKLHLRAGGKTSWQYLCEPDLPALDYEPVKYDYERLTDSQRGISPWPSHWRLRERRSTRSGAATGEDLGGAPSPGFSTATSRGSAKAYLDFKNVFMMHLPRLCEHC